ncbi:MAG: LLM class F420-dependent oxidoreductase [Dehalococcoidia bacterium]
MQRWGFTYPLDAVPIAAHREVLQQAESLGYTDAWTAEVDQLDGFVPIAPAALWTERMRFGTAIANVFIRGPALLAQQAAAVAEVAPGRFVLGVGASSPAIIENWNGMEMRRPLERVRETVAFLRQVFAGERAANETLGVRGFRLGRRFADPPPIFIAALRKKMLELAGSEGDGVIINWLGPDDVPKVVSVAREAATRAGRGADAFEVVCRIFVIPTDNDAIVQAVARRAIAGYMTTPVYSGFQRWLGRGEALAPMQEAWAAGDRQQATALVPEQVIEDLFVTGDRNACLDKIESYVKNGVTVPVLSFLPAVLDFKELGKRNMELIKELAPR